MKNLHIDPKYLQAGPIENFAIAIRSSFLSVVEPEVNLAAVKRSRGDNTTCFCTDVGCGGRPRKGLPLEIEILPYSFADIWIGFDEAMDDRLPSRRRCSAR
jgi:hypothetical protein